MRQSHGAALVVSALLAGAASESLCAQGRATGRVLAPSTHGHAVERDVAVRHESPDWLAAPAKGRLVTPPGAVFVPLQNASVSFENASLGMMVGALRN